MQQNHIKYGMIFLVFGFFFLALALCIIASTPKASGYEIYLKNAYHFYFWVLIVLAASLGISVLIFESYITEKPHLWLFGFLLVIITNTIVLLLPVFRGYFLYGRGDVLSHLSEIKGILDTGSLGIDNYYPISHILVVNLVHILGLEPQLGINITPALFNILYMSGMYLLATVVSDSWRQVLLITALGGVLLYTYFGSMFLPTHMSFIFISFIFYIFFKKSKIRSQAFSLTILFVILVLLIPFFHPLTSIQLINMFLILSMIFLIAHKNKVKIRQSNFNYSLPLSKFFLPASLIFVTFFLWFSQFGLFRAKVKQISNWLMLEVGKPPVETFQSMYVHANLSFNGFLEVFFKSYGHEFIFSGFSLLAVVAIFKNLKKNFKEEEIIFSMFFIFFSLEFLIFLLGIEFVGNPQRNFEWALFATIIINGMFYQKYITNFGENVLKKTVAFCFSIIILITCVTIGMFSSYSSPLMGEINSQVTIAEIEGMDWYIDHYNGTRTFSWDKRAIERLVEPLLGRHEYFKTVRNFYSSPHHFGYQQGQEFVSDGCLIISDYEKNFYMERWPVGGVFTRDDFLKLKNDPKKSLIFDNNSMEIWRVIR